MSTAQLSSTLLDAQTPGKQSASILIVDDEKALRLVLSRAMEGEGYRTIDANSGERCLSICQNQLPDVILLDAVMPGMDGFRCCSQLKAMFSDRCPPVLMITALYDQDSVNKAFAAGAIDFITKPIHWAILRQRVQRLLATSHLTAQWQASLTREQLLKQQVETATQKVQYLTELCQSKGVEIDS
jgi:PleD family two-component response regulator